MEIDNDVKRDEVEKLVRELMEGEGGVTRLLEGADKEDSELDRQTIWCWCSSGISPQGEYEACTGRKGSSVTSILGEVPKDLVLELTVLGLRVVDAGVDGIIVQGYEVGGHVIGQENEVRRLAGIVPNASTTWDIESMATYAGEGVRLIREILPAGVIVEGDASIVMDPMVDWSLLPD
ncbi:hypothetical protein L1049_014889 [Liquidambar formosana]|uniref:Uncharacterized protein n=1 Tax=Liquidambar formosana TaxID=63359 RepID=A0AAP0RX42_LIQFO